MYAIGPSTNGHPQRCMPRIWRTVDKLWRKALATRNSMDDPAAVVSWVGDLVAVGCCGSCLSRMLALPSTQLDDHRHPIVNTMEKPFAWWWYPKALEPDRYITIHLQLVPPKSGVRMKPADYHDLDGGLPWISRQA